MTTDMRDQAAVEQRLWAEIERHQIGMLGIIGTTSHHTQPMTAFVERAGGQLWFFTSANTELARSIAEGRPAMFVFQHRDLQACITGELTLQHDPARIDRYWNAVVAAWHAGGRSDPLLTLMCLDCRDAEVWISEAGPIKYAWEIARANTTHRPPHVGGRVNLHFH
jgi:general stress protein 26